MLWQEYRTNINKRNQIMEVKRTVLIKKKKERIIVKSVIWDMTQRDKIKVNSFTHHSDIVYLSSYDIIISVCKIIPCLLLHCRKFVGPKTCCVYAHLCPLRMEKMHTVKGHTHKNCDKVWRTSTWCFQLVRQFTVVYVTSSQVSSSWQQQNNKMKNEQM